MVHLSSKVSLSVTCIYTLTCMRFLLIVSSEAAESEHCRDKADRGTDGACNSELRC